MFGVEAELLEEIEVFGGEVVAVRLEEAILFCGQRDISKLCDRTLACLWILIKLCDLLLIWSSSHRKAARDSFLSGVLLVKAYVTGTSLKHLNTAHCIVNLYKSVSKKDITPSGKGEELLKSIVTTPMAGFSATGSRMGDVLKMFE